MNMNINIVEIQSPCSCAWCEEGLGKETIITLGSYLFHEKCFSKYMEELETVQPLNFDEDDYADNDGWVWPAKADTSEWEIF